MLKNKIIVIGGLPESLINFRGDLLSAFSKANFDVTAMSAPASDEVLSALEKKGVQFKAINIQRNGLNPFSDLKLLLELYFHFKKLRPLVIFAYTIKPIIWGGLAARFTGVPFYALVTGLGFAFQGDSFKRKILTRVVSNLYKMSLKRAKAVIFQNNDNRDLFLKHKIVQAQQCHVINGSGVNLDYYKQAEMPKIVDSKITFLCIARLLKEKGLYEYAQAAEIVKQYYPQTKFNLLGPIDSSPDGILLAIVKSWEAISYLGEADDIRTYINDCHIYVLPSYHEGMPRSILEAMAVGRAIITTDTVGCKDTVYEGVNGFKVPIRNSKKLAEKMIWCIEHSGQLSKMGKESYQIAVDKFDVHKVNNKIMAILNIKENNSEAFL